MNIRAYVKQMRLDRDITQQQLADKIGITQQYVNMIEIGTRQQDMTYSMMEKLAEAFDVPVQTIINAESDYAASIAASKRVSA